MIISNLANPFCPFDEDSILTTSVGGDGWFNGEIPFEDYSVLVDFNGNVLTR